MLAFCYQQVKRRPPASDLSDYVISLSPDGEYVLLPRYDGQTIVWHYPSGRTVTWLSHHDAPTSALFSPDGRWVLTTGYRQDNRILAWDVGQIRNGLGIK
jgi:WD40 repeat protein